MIKIGRLIFLLIAFLWLASPALAQTVPSDVHVKLVLAENKTTFRIGDEIKFFLEFTADRDGYKAETLPDGSEPTRDRKSTRLNSSHLVISYAVFCLKKKD